MPTTQGFFITGTDTNVGKTAVAAAIAREAYSHGRRVGVYKPAASGCERDPCGNAVSDDAQQLWQAAGKPLSLNQVCPQRFRLPLAPYLAAQAEGVTVDAELLSAGLSPWGEFADLLLVEGAGGLLSPLTREISNLDLAKQFGLPLLIVAADRIGMINQVRLSVLAARTLAPELPIAGIIINEPVASNAQRDPSILSNAAELRVIGVTPILGRLTYNASKIFWENRPW